MKIISLNIWGGKIYEPLMEFIKKHSRSVDVFCFQEAYKSPSGISVSREMHMNILEDITNILPEYEPFFGPVQDGWDSYGPVDFEVSFGQATFARNTVKVIPDSVKQVFICGEKNSAEPKDETSMPASMFCLNVLKSGKIHTICNVHGFARPGSKLDTPERILQSRKIKDFLNKEENKTVILCGDFNLMPETESVKMLEENLENLIKKFNITNTRSRLSQYHGTLDEQKFADYMFVSSDIRVMEFKVLDDQVSDHLPLYLEFS